MATITITLDSTQAQRLQSAFSKQFDLRDADQNPRIATMADIKQHLVRELRAIVQLQERKGAEDTIVSAPFDPA